MNNLLIHVASIREPSGSSSYLFLRQLDDFRFVWFQEKKPEKEEETTIWGATTEEAIFNARRHWKNKEFQTLHCGFRYHLPERDEIGTNALFYQMAASYSSMTGVYFDQDVGHNCIVQNASNEAKQLWRKLKEK